MTTEKHIHYWKPIPMMSGRYECACSATGYRKGGNIVEHKGWLEGKLEDPNFERLVARENFIEYFLTEIDRIMREQKITRAELARRMNCRPANVTQLFRRTRNLTATSMVDLAFHLNLKLRLLVEQRGG